MAERCRPRIFVAGGSPLLVAALIASFEGSSNLIVGWRAHIIQSTSGLDRSAADYIRNVHPNVVLLALQQNNVIDALPAVREIAEACKSSRLLALLDSLDWIACLTLLRIGVSGILGPDFQRTELFRAISFAAEGRLYLDPRIPRRGTTFELSTVSDAGSKGLSTREAEVLRLLARGYSNKAIAAVLNLSVKTVETYRVRGMEKLGIRSKIELVDYAATSGWNSTESYPL